MKLVGNSNLETLAEFADGQRSITEGEIYKEPNESIVSKEFAELNDISVGDTIEVNSVMGEGNPYTLTVTGIYLDYCRIRGHAHGDEFYEPPQRNFDEF